MAANPINWDTIRQQLAKTKDVIEHRAVYTAEQINQILHKRAGQLSLKTDTSAAQADETTIIAFVLENEHYGIEAEYVHRVFNTIKITPLPSSHTLIKGIMNDHGNILCVVDLKSVFGLAQHQDTSSYDVITISHQDIEMGILVDSIIGIESIQTNALQTSLPTLKGIQADILKGISHNQRIILNIPALMTRNELRVNDTV
jgi:purine-binding chemotaxis protein CheW